MGFGKLHRVALQLQSAVMGIVRGPIVSSVSIARGRCVCDAAACRFATRSAAADLRVAAKRASDQRHAAGFDRLLAADGADAFAGLRLQVDLRGVDAEDLGDAARRSLPCAATASAARPRRRSRDSPAGSPRRSPARTPAAASRPSRDCGSPRPCWETIGRCPAARRRRAGRRSPRAAARRRRCGRANAGRAARRRRPAATARPPRCGASPRPVRCVGSLRRSSPIMPSARIIAERRGL